jgi:predicted dehydrogenase
MSADDPTKPLNAAVIGCGGIANEHLPFLAKSPLVQLVGVCDTSKATAQFAQQRFGAIGWYLDAGEMLAATKPDVVHVLTPPQTHAALVSLSLKAGAHVICEKPMTASAGDTAKLLTLAQKQEKWLIESRNLLFNDAVLRIDALLREGVLGDVREIDLLLSLDLNAGPFGDLNLDGPGVQLPGGAVQDFLPHLAYLFLHFASCTEPVDTVQGTLDNLSGNARVGFDHLDALVTTGNCRGRLRIASDLKPDMFRLIVRGTKAMVETDFYNPFLRVQRSEDSGKMAPFEQVRSGVRLARAGFGNLRDKVLQHGTYHGMPRMLDAIYQALSDGRDPPITAADIATTAILVDRLVSLGSTK